MTQKRPRRKKPITMQDLRSTVTYALGELERIYTTHDQDTDKVIRAINSLSVLVNSYIRLSEVADFEARLKKLERLHETSSK